MNGGSTDGGQDETRKDGGKNDRTLTFEAKHEEYVDNELDSTNGRMSCDVNEPMAAIVDPEDRELLAKLLQANRMLEADSRSLNSLSPRTTHKTLHPTTTTTTTTPDGDSAKLGHSRQSSMSSIVSGSSVCSGGSNFPCDDGNQEGNWVVWGNLVTDWDNIFRKKSGQVKELVRRGVPHPFRGIVWQLLCNANDCSEKERYADYLKQTSPFEKTIGRDITRTFPGHELFKEKDGLGQESLFNVMKAYSLYDREVGYCQGSSFIVGLLLMQMPEEESFAVLVRIMYAFNLRELFKPSMAELGVCMYQLEAMIQDQLPELYNHFQMHGVATSMFASSWFLAIFTTVLPIPLACRIFDVFLSEGMEVIFRVGIAILQLNMDELLTLDMEETVKFLQKDLSLKVETDPDILLNSAFTVKYNARKMKKLEKEYTAIKTKEQEEQVELRRLRAENKLLQQRIDNLEKETETLADRLIHDQIKCAQREEEICVLKCRVEKQQRIANELVAADGSTALSPATSSDSVSSSSTKPPVVSRPSVLWQTTGDKDQCIEQLQKELDETNAALMRLHHKVSQLENDNYQSQPQRDTSVELRVLQEDLIACKLHEAEANMAIKELQHQVFEMEKHWEKFRERNRQNCEERMNSSANGGGGGGGGVKIQQLNENLMAAQIREAVLVSEMTDLKQKLVQLEQQNHTNEVRLSRSVDETNILKKILTEKTRETEELKSQLENMKTKQSEDNVVNRLRETEQSQLIAGLRQRIAELEIENASLTDKVRQMTAENNNGSSTETNGTSSMSTTPSDKPSPGNKIYLRYGATNHQHPGFGTPTSSHNKPTAAVAANALRSSLPDVDADRTPTNDAFSVDAFIRENEKSAGNAKFEARRLAFVNHPPAAS